MSKRLNYQQLSPQATNAAFAFSKAVDSADLNKNLTDLVRIRASQLNGCMFCLDMHTKEAYIHGEKPLRLHHLPTWRESPLFTDRERAALEWTELLTQPGKHGAEDSDYQAALKHFSEKELSDLTFVVATINAWNRLGIAFRNTPGALDKLLGLDKAGL